MKINKCRICNSSKLVNLFSLGKLCFTGKFPSKKQIIKKEPIKLILCKKSLINLNFWNKNLLITFLK